MGAMIDVPPGNVESAVSRLGHPLPKRTGGMHRMRTHTTTVTVDHVVGEREVVPISTPTFRVTEGVRVPVAAVVVLVALVVVEGDTETTGSLAMTAADEPAGMIGTDGRREIAREIGTEGRGAVVDLLCETAIGTCTPADRIGQAVPAKIGRRRAAEPGAKKLAASPEEPSPWPCLQ